MRADVISTGLPASVCRQHPRVLGDCYAGKAPAVVLVGACGEGGPGQRHLVPAPRAVAKAARVARL
jgi:hypothetical protein